MNMEVFSYKWLVDCTTMHSTTTAQTAWGAYDALVV